MRRAAFFLLASGLFWTGCIGNDSLATASIAQRNVENLGRLSAGMTSSQVFQIMRKPYRNEMFDLDGDRYEIWFYVTNLTLMDQKSLTHKNLTPLTFRNGVLEGKGYNDYYKILNTEMETDTSKPEEDSDLEKALNAPKNNNTPAKKAPPAPPPADNAAKPATKPQAKPMQPPQGSNKPTQPPKQTPGSGAKPKTSPPPTQGSKPAPQSKPVSMSRPAKEPPPENAAAEKEKGKEKEQSKEQPKKKPPLSKEDQRVLDEEQEENFNFW